MCLESDNAVNQDFNISTPVATSVLELGEIVWNILNPDKPFKTVSDPAYRYDVQKRIPNVLKAEELVGFKAEIGLEESILEVIEYMRNNNEA